MNQALRHFAALLLFSATALLSEAPAKKLAPVVQPYVDSKTLAGAVVLVADPDKVLDVEAVGFEDVAAMKACSRERFTCRCCGDAQPLKRISSNCTPIIERALSPRRLFIIRAIILLPGIQNINGVNTPCVSR